uniref:CRAL-TRIO domain-containing protein n=1 Tax=viral metagenome TaxID=1070528 RepID=A0A6C0AQQ4_9ZZZZ
MCDLCRVNPNTHSFEKITEQRGTHVFYTSFQHILDYSHFPSVRNHIELGLAPVTGKPWAWIIDCKYLESKHLIQLHFAVQMIKYLRREHTRFLQNIYILNGGLLVNVALKTLMPFVDRTFYKSIIMIEGSRLDILMRLEGLGWSLKESEPIMNRLLSEYK